MPKKSSELEIACSYCGQPLRSNAVHARVVRDAQGEILYLHDRPNRRGNDCYDKAKKQLPETELERLRRNLIARGVIASQ